MGNLGHFKSLVGLLKIVGLILGIIAASTGAYAYSKSAYNESCRNSEVFPPGGGSSSSPIVATSPESTLTTLRTRETDVSSVPTTTLPTSTSTSDLTSEGFTDTTEEGGGEEELSDPAPVLWMERFLISVTWMCVGTSAILLLLCLLIESLEYNKLFKAVNFGFHFVGAVLLIIGAIFMGFATYEIDRQICKDYFDNKEECQLYRQKLTSAAFAILQSIVYTALSYKIISTKLYEEV